MKSPNFSKPNGYLYFSKNDRIAILILLALIFLVLSASLVLRNFQFEKKETNAEILKLFTELDTETDLQNKKKLFAFDPNCIDSIQLDSLDIPQFIKKNLINYRNAGGYFSDATDIRKLYGMNDSIFAAIEKYILISPRNFQKKSEEENRVSVEKLTGTFNPNTVNLDTLLKFGFNRFQAENLLKYRNKGGKFEAGKDLLKIYGIDSLFYFSVANHVHIPKELKNEATIEVVEINEADAISFQKIDGIGTILATRIVKYRNIIGGYYSKKQLLEVYNFPPDLLPEIENQLLADTSKLKKIRINFADFKELQKHPYFNKTQINEILKYRDKNGAFNNIEQIRSIQSIDSATFRRIRPYISCR